MKLTLAVFVSLWSLTAFSYQSAHNHEYFHGQGVAIHPDGSAERYLISLAVRKKSMSKYVLSYDIQFGDRNVFFDLAYVHDSADSSFFSVHVRAEEGYKLVGHGYCWGPKCHVNYSWNDMNVENTFYRNRRTGNLYGMGSKTGKEGMVYIWKEVLTNIK